MGSVGIHCNTKNTMEPDAQDPDSATPEQAPPKQSGPNRVPPIRKKKGIGKRKKQGDSYVRWKDEQAALAAQPPQDPAPDDVPVEEPVNEAQPAKPKKVRSDDGWRVDRGIRSRDKKIEKRDKTIEQLTEQVQKLKGEKKVEAGRASDLERRVKEAEHQKYVDAKASREMLLKAEEEHKVELQKMQDEFYAAVREANMAADAEMSKALAAEHARILAEQRHGRELKKEQVKLAKERSGHEAVVSHIHNQQRKKDARWQDKLDKKDSDAQKQLAMKDKEMEAKLGEKDADMAKKEEEMAGLLREKDDELMADRITNQER